MWISWLRLRLVRAHEARIDERSMKRWILFSGLFLLSCQAIRAQTAPLWINRSSIIAPPAVAPQVDAVTFVNTREGIINISFPGDYLPLFDTTSTLNLTNDGFMS